MHEVNICIYIFSETVSVDEEEDDVDEELKEEELLALAKAAAKVRV